MTDDTPPVLYISADTSGLTTRYKATPRMHMGAEAWVPKKTLEALYWRLRSYAFHDDNCTFNRPPHYRGCSCGLTAALAALPAPDEGGTMEPVVDGQIWHERRGQLPDGDPRKPKSGG